MSENKYPEHKKRNLLLSNRISQSSVKDVMESIFEINEDDIAEEDEAVYCTCEGDDDFDIEIDGEDDGIEDEE